MYLILFVLSKLRIALRYFDLWKQIKGKVIIQLRPLILLILVFS